MRDAVDEVSWNSTPYGPRAPSISPPLKCDRELSSRPWYPSAPKAFFFFQCAHFCLVRPQHFTLGIMFERILRATWRPSSCFAWYNNEERPWKILASLYGARSRPYWYAATEKDIGKRSGGTTELHEGAGSTPCLPSRILLRLNYVRARTFVYTDIHELFEGPCVVGINVNFRTTAHIIVHRVSGAYNP